MSRPRALIIDDEPAVRAVLHDFFEFLDIDTDLVGSAEEAFGRLRERPYDCVLLDEHLPGMAGSGAVTVIAELCPTARVVVMSGASTVPALDVLRAQGVVVLAKPISLEDFAATIRRLLATAVV